MREVDSYSLRKNISKSCGCRKFPNENGKRFGRWLVLKTEIREGVSRHNRIRCLCKCDCGTEKWVLINGLRTGMTTSCGCYWDEKYGNVNVGRPEYELWCHAKGRARKLKIPFNIEVDDIIIPTHCPVLGIKLIRGKQGFHGPSPSLDRIKPELGYVKGNVKVICWRANRIKSDSTVSEIKAILSYMEQ